MSWMILGWVLVALLFVNAVVMAKTFDRAIKTGIPESDEEKYELYELRVSAVVIFTACYGMILGLNSDGPNVEHGATDEDFIVFIDTAIAIVYNPLFVAAVVGLNVWSLLTKPALSPRLHGSDSYGN